MRLLAALAGVMSIGVFLRLYRLADWFYYTFDEEVISFVGKRMVVEHHFPAIGGVTPLKFHLGPLFYYISGFVLWVADLDPLGWGVFAAAIAAIALVFTFLVGRAFFDTKTGIVAILLMATSYLMVITDRHYWPLLPNPLYALLTLYSLWKIKKGRRVFTLILFGTLTLASHTDPSNFVLILLSVIVWWHFRLPVRSRFTLVGVGLFVLANVIPLGWFELRHDFYNTRQFATFFQGQHNQPGFRLQKLWGTLAIFPNTFSRSLAVTKDHDMSIQLSPCGDIVPQRTAAIPWYLWWGSTAALVWFGWFFWRRRKDGPSFFGVRMIVWFAALLFVGITIYSNIFNADLYEQYLSGFVPFFFMIAAFVLTRAGHGVWFWVSVFVILQLVIGNTASVLQGTNRFGWADKIEAMTYVAQALNGRPYYLQGMGTCYAYGGYRYLSRVVGHEPVASYVDGDLSWLYDTPPWTAEKIQAEGSIARVTIAAPNPYEGAEYEERYAAIASSSHVRRTFGAIEVLIEEEI